MAEQTTGGTPGGTSSGSSGLAPNVASLLCYLCGWLTGLIFLLIEKESREVRYHAWNSITIDVVTIVLYIGLTILGIIFTSIAAPLGFITMLLNFFLWLGYIGLKIYLMIKAYQGERVRLPVIGDFVEKQATK